MTNQDKAREIELNVYAFGEKPKGEFQAPAYRAALEMAEWKDEQFKEYLMKKLEYIRDSYQKSKTEYKKDYYSTQMVVIAEIIDELFKE